jgi:carbon storage regulator
MLMLVLTRKVGESIAIGDHIKIKVVEVKGAQIRLGLEAPSDVKIYREEVYEKVTEQNRLAASWDIDDFRKVASLFTDKDKES